MSDEPSQFFSYTAKYGFNLRQISPLSINNELDNNTNILAGD